ncbi:hypothetical protein [Agarivorans sp. 3_MG-2023]|uniref:hypothetical protein n=2 Tax=Agarivorans TaxID=261825 RepID=UPI0026E16885|nr:hypothetical protein [Agarivorans sp. 3_MG-2023]
MLIVGDDMNKLLIFLVLTLSATSSWGKTVKCYMAGSNGIDQVIIASPKGLSNLDAISEELKSRYTEHQPTVQKLGGIVEFECVGFNDSFSSDIANTRFAELQY